MKKYFISGWVFSQERYITGIPRCFIEWIRRLDEKVANQKDVELFYVYPKNAPHHIFDPRSLKNIKTIEISDVKRKIGWRYFDFPKYIKKNNGTAIFFNPEITKCKNFIVFVPDIRPLIYKTDTFKFKILFKYQMKIIKKKAKVILTDSFEEEKNLKKFLNPKANIKAIYCGWEHINNITEKSDILNRFTLEKKNFYFTLGSLAPHKNLKWVIDYASKHPNDIFVISGSFNSSYWKKEELGELNNVVFTGHINDADIKELMTNCKAYLHPAIYEGFGIPPLEALALGTKIVISNIPVFKEVYEDIAEYIDLDNKNYEIPTNIIERNREKILSKCSWDKACDSIMDVLTENN